MEAPAKEIIEKAADVVESVGAVVTKRKRKRTRSPTTSVPSTVLAGAQASAVACMHILMVSPLVHRSNAFDAMTVPIDRLDNVANAVLYSMYVVTTETSSLVTPD